MKRINISFYILILCALIVGYVVIAILNKASILFTSKNLILCQKFISNIMLEVPRSLPNVLVLTVGIVLGIGFLSFIVQLIKTRIFLRKLLLNRINISSGLAKTLETLNLTNKVILIKDKNLFSFCCGIFSPFIIVTTNLVRSLSDKELESVLLHEQSHMVSRDPIKVLIGKTFSSMFFFLPLFRELHKNIEGTCELLADQWTITHQQNSTFLRNALKKILVFPQKSMNFVSNASGPDYFEIRINRLVNPGAKHKFRLSLISVFSALLFILVSWFLLQTPVSAFHMNSKVNSMQCHSNTQKPASYIPIHFNLTEKKCNIDNSGISLLH